MSMVRFTSFPLPPLREHWRAVTRYASGIKTNCPDRAVAPVFDRAGIVYGIG